MMYIEHDSWQIVFNYLNLREKYSLSITPKAFLEVFYDKRINNEHFTIDFKTKLPLGQFLLNNITIVKIEHPVFRIQVCLYIHTFQAIAFYRLIIR